MLIISQFTKGVELIELESSANKFTKLWVNQSSYYDILDYFRNRNII